MMGIGVAVITAVAVLAVCRTGCTAETPQPAGLTYKLDELGDVRTWMISEPVNVGPKEAFENDLLKDFGGEQAIRPTGLVTEAKDKKLTWKVITSGKPVVRPSIDPIEDVKVFYFYTTITPARSGKHTLMCGYWSDVVLWVDGKRVAAAERKWRDAMAVCEATVDLEKGKNYPVLVKLSSSLRQAALQLRITEGEGEKGRGGEGEKDDSGTEGRVDAGKDANEQKPKPVGRRPADVTCSLPVPADQKSLASYLPDALNMTIDNYLFLQPDRTASVFVWLADAERRARLDDTEPAKDAQFDRVPPPGLTAPLTARVVMRTREGKELATIKLGQFDPGKLAGKPLSFSYRPKKSDVSPFYAARLEILHDGVLAGSLERKFYCLEGIQQLGEEVQKRAEKFYKERNEEELYEDRDLAYLLLKLEQLKMLYDKERRSFNFGDRAIEIVLDAQRRVEIMEKRLHINPGPGMHDFVYVSKVDDSAQPYRVFVPLSYQAMKGAPLVVYLHGYYDIDKLNWEGIPESVKDLCEQYGYLLVEPFGRSNTDYQGIGEEDVMHVLSLVRQQYNVHPDRIFLLGYSMGGMGSYTIAGHYPDVFAGVIALAGRADFYMWRRIRPDDIQPFKRWLVDLEFGNALSENFRHVPVLAIQGENDTVVEAEQSPAFVKRLKALQYDAQYVPVRDSWHWVGGTVFATDFTFKWMEERRRPQAPKKVTYSTVSLKYNKAYWLTIDDFRRWGDRAYVDAEVTGPNEITVQQANVAAFSLQMPKELVDLTKPLAVKVTGGGAPKELKFDPPFKGPISVVLEKARPSALRKTPQLCGPYKDMLNTRFVIVYGTQGEPVENKMLYQQAEVAVQEWRQFTQAVQLLEHEKDPLMVRDRDLEDEQKEKCNLILIGSPRTNSVLAQIAGKLPIKFEGQNTLVVGDKKFSGPGLGLNMIYPSPFNASRYVAVKWGIYYGLRLSANHKYDLLPDYIIYDQTPDREIPDQWDGVPSRSRCAGFFDKYWQLDDKVMWTQGAAPAGD